MRARVKRMQDLEILRIVAFADPQRLGNQQLALVMLTVDPHRHAQVVERGTCRISLRSPTCPPCLAGPISARRSAPQTISNSGNS